ncbi:MAG: ABC transporter ATP-binding protein [Acidimicrobiales bacterium]
MTTTPPDPGQSAREAEFPPSAIVSVRDLRVHFRSKAGVVHAVDGVDFDIADGETLGLVGETGCGKSVTARSFLQLVPSPPALPTQGSILFRERSAGAQAVDLVDADREHIGDIRGNRIAMIFQDPGKALNPALSIRDQLVEVFLVHRTEEVLTGAGISPEDTGFGARLLRREAGLRTRRLEKFILGIPPLRARRHAIRAASNRLVEAALSETQIPNPANVMDRYPHELSGGMKQRVMIAQALACNPDLLIADEPTTALDVTVQARIIELIKELQVSHQTSVLYISHDLSLVRRVCDRIAVMYAGRIAEIGPADEIFHNPQHPYTRGLLAAIPSSESKRGHLDAIEGSVPELIDPKPGCRFATRCRHATDLCRTEDPELLPLDGAHEVACFIHHHHDDATAPSFDRSSDPVIA